MEITIPHRYCGPPESGNGGWVCGTVAAHVPTTSPRPAVTVRLASPPPLDRAMSLEAEPADGGVLLRLARRRTTWSRAARHPPTSWMRCRRR